MAMQYLEGELRHGNAKDQAYADIIAGVLKDRGKDIELAKADVVPQVATSKETVPVEVKRFSDEAREALTKEGYVIYALNGQSIKTQREVGKKFWSTWHKDYPDFETLPSMHSQVAIKPDALFIPDSNRKTLKEQQDIIAKLGAELGEKVQGVEAVMGNAADYVGLAFAHLDATIEAGNPEYLFGEKDHYNYARTKTPTVGGGVALVGFFDADDGLGVVDWSPDGRYDRVFASPLVVPN